MKRKPFNVKFIGFSSTLVFILFFLFFIIFFTSDGKYSSEFTSNEFKIYDFLNTSDKISVLDKNLQKSKIVQNNQKIQDSQKLQNERKSQKTPNEINFENVQNERKIDNSQNVRKIENDQNENKIENPPNEELMEKKKVLKNAEINGDFNDRKCKVTIGIILCSEEKDGDEFPGLGKDFSRQINQTIVLLKSILISGGFDHISCVNVILLSNKYSHYLNIKTTVGGWNPRFKDYFKISFAPVIYPSDSLWMKKLFRPCATLRLFIPDLLPQVDSLIYLDTDIIFLRGIEDLWGEFESFGSSALGGMAPCLFHYGTQFNLVPFYGPSGLNAGIMLMNLTRMRQTVLSHKLTTIAQIFKQKIRLADQDILNIYFHYFPHHLHVLSCDWNFRPFQCREGSFCESDQIASEGISALHGNALSFTPRGPEKLFHTVYQTYANHLNITKEKMEREILLFLDTLEFNLEEAEEHVHSECKKYGAFSILVLNRLRKIGQKIQIE